MVGASIQVRVRMSQALPAPLAWMASGVFATPLTICAAPTTTPATGIVSAPATPGSTTKHVNYETHDASSLALLLQQPAAVSFLAAGTRALEEFLHDSRTRAFPRTMRCRLPKDRHP